MDTYFAVFLFIVLAYIAAQLIALCGRLQHAEAMLQKLLEVQGVEWGKPAEPSDEVKRLARADASVVDAIRAYRQQTGLGLKEAREIVERLARKPSGDAPSAP